MEINNKNIPELLLGIVFILYLIMGYQIPSPIANLIDTTFGKIIIIIFALILFAFANPILGVLSLLVAYQLIIKSSITTGMAGLEQYYPTEEKKWSPYTDTNQFPYTLEQEVVKNMTTQTFNTEYVKAPFKPLLDDTHDASYLTN